MKPCPLFSSRVLQKIEVKCQLNVLKLTWQTFIFLHFRVSSIWINVTGVLLDFFVFLKILALLISSEFLDGDLYSLESIAFDIHVKSLNNFKLSENFVRRSPGYVSCIKHWQENGRLDICEKIQVVDDELAVSLLTCGKAPSTARQEEIHTSA